MFTFRSNSISDYKDILFNNVTKKYVKAEFFIFIISDMMKTTKGRDKICGFIQYLNRILYLSSFYTNLPQYKYLNLHENKYNQMFYKIYKSMKDGRKIFRFLKFMDIYINIVNLKKGKDHILLMKYISEISTFFYYILDNTLWAINLGILDNIINVEISENTKYFKTLSSFIRILMVTYINILKYKKSKKFENINKKKCLLNNHENKINLQKLIDSRNKIRNLEINIFQNLLRFIMLYYNLSLPLFHIVHPIFIPFCGLISNIISIIKYCNEKKSIKILNVEDNPEIDFQTKKEFIKSLSTIFSKQKKN